MKVKLTVHYEDTSSGILKFEKPPGVHPKCILVLAEGMLEAEKNGKRVSKIGWSEVNPFSGPPGPLVIDDQLYTRDEALKIIEGSMRPMVEKYKPLFQKTSGGKNTQKEKST